MHTKHVHSIRENMPEMGTAKEAANPRVLELHKSKRSLTERDEHSALRISVH
jgi:hypothetical protein